MIVIQSILSPFRFWNYSTFVTAVIVNNLQFVAPEILIVKIIYIILRRGSKIKNIWYIREMVSISCLAQQCVQVSISSKRLVGADNDWCYCPVFGHWYPHTVWVEFEKVWIWNGIKTHFFTTATKTSVPSSFLFLFSSLFCTINFS